MQVDIELRNVEASSPLMRSLSRSEESFDEDRIETPFGTILVAHQGADHRAPKPVILTYHDAGLNHVSNFQAFFNYMDMKLLLQSFAVFHINAPGQEEGSPSLPDNFVYPTMDQLAEQIEVVCKFYEIKHFIGLGVGLGANILSRFALKNPDYVDGLFLINPTSTQSGWTEWFYQKLNIHYLGTALNLGSATSAPSFPQSTQDYLMWHHFGKVTTERNRDLVELYRNYYTGKTLNGRNLSMLLESYIKRNDLGLVRGEKEKNFKCSVLILTGFLSPHVEDTVTMNSRLDPSNSTWMKLSDCGMPLVEQPGKVAEALRLFIQGLGYALTAYERRRSSVRKASLSSTSGDLLNGNQSRKNSMDDDGSAKIVTAPGQEVHIVENPIAQC